MYFVRSCSVIWTVGGKSENLHGECIQQIFTDHRFVACRFDILCHISGFHGSED